MFYGALECDLLLGDIHSLKAKRSAVRPLIAQIRRKFEVAAAEVDHLDLHRRAGVGVVATAADARHVTAVLDAVEEYVAGLPEFDLLSTRRRLHHIED